MIRAANATENAANAATSSATTAKNSLETSQRQFRAEQRPYIWAAPEPGGVDASGATPKKIVLVPLVNGNYKIAWTVGIYNGGHSPAKEEVSTVSESHIVEQTKFAQEVKKFVPNYRSYPGQLFPPQVSMMVPTGQYIEITKEQLAEVTSETKIIYVIGAIKYRDIFEPAIEPYETRYCFKYNPSTPNYPNPLPLATCPEGNTIK
jgi:hypothetical protein